MSSPAPRPAVARPENLELRLSPRARPRFFPALGVLHEPGGRGRGRDFAIDSEGHATRIHGDPFASRERTAFVDVIGDWPRSAWARVVVEDGGDPAEGGGDPAEGGGDRSDSRRLLEWSGSSWSEVTESGARPISHSVAGEPQLLAGGGAPSSAPPALPRASLLALTPWSGDDALAARFQFGETPATEGGRPWEERCDPATQSHLGTSATPPPEMRIEGCLFAPHALATSAAQDVFLLAQPRLGRPLRRELIAWGPLEVQRWSRGEQVAARDDVASMIGFRPGILDPWEHRTLLVASATDAYLAVTSSPPTAPDGSAAPQGGIATAQVGEIVLLHFDGSRWSETLRAPPPWGGMERASDGSIWVIAGSRLHVAPPSTTPAAPRAFWPVAIASVPGAGGLRPVVPLQVMPWSSRRASVIGRFGNELGLFTVVRSDDSPPPLAPRSAPREARAPGSSLAADPPGRPGATKTKPMQVQALDSDRRPMVHRPYVMLAGGRWFEGVTAADGNVAVDIPDSADILELIVWQPPPAGSFRWTFDVVDALPPAGIPAGARVRLRNLAYLQDDVGDELDVLDEALVRALRAFQSDERIPVTGVLDPATVRSLQARYGH